MCQGLKKKQKHPYRPTQNNIWPNAWASPGPIKLTPKIGHHICIHFCGLCIVVGYTYHWTRQHSALVITTSFPGWLYQFTLIRAVCLEFCLLCILTSTWCDQSFSFHLHDGCAVASVMCWIWLLWLWESAVHTSSQFCNQWCHTGSLKPTTVVVFTPKKCFNFWKLGC